MSISRKRESWRLGTASGFLGFPLMERQGGEEVAYDLTDCQSHFMNVVPYARYDHRVHFRNLQDGLRKLNNAFWFAIENSAPPPAWSSETFMRSLRRLARWILPPSAASCSICATR